jgi:hypothetical protein
MYPTERIIITDHSSKKWLYALGGFIAGVAGTVAAAFFIADSDKGSTTSQTVSADEPEGEAAEFDGAEDEEATQATTGDDASATAEDNVKATAESPST